MANELVLMDELGKLDAEKAAVKLAPKVGLLLAELDPKKLKLGNLVKWRENLNAAWRTEDNARIISLPNDTHPTKVKLGGKPPGHTWWVEIEDVSVKEEAPEPESKPSASPTEQLARLSECKGDRGCG